jgi:hypothetical protein
LKRWIRRILRGVLAGLGLLLIVIAAEIAIGWRCNLQGELLPPVPSPPERKAATAGIKDYARPEDDTLLSYPEWYIVWSYQEKADFQQAHLASSFPYLGAVRQYWSGYCCISRLLRRKYPFNGGEQVMLVVIGTSFSAEYILKGVYENTVGKLSEWSSSGEPTEEDLFAYQVAREYADFVHVRPFYEFHFARQVPGMWKGTGLLGAHWLRKWERKLFLTADYTIEALYCWFIEKMTHLTYGSEPDVTYAWLDSVSAAVTSQLPHVRLVKQVGPAAGIASIPRYQEFTAVASTLSGQGVQFVEIAGNSLILISVVEPQDWHLTDADARPLFSTPILTDPKRQRIVMLCNVPTLSRVLNAVAGSRATVEHVYDY